MAARILARPLFWLGIAGALFVLLGFTLHSCTKARQAGAESNLATEAGKAASANGSDAVEAVSGAAGRDAETDKTTMENVDAIRIAKGADAPVYPAVRGAGLDSLCRRAAYRCTEQCVQRAVARGVANAGAGCPASAR